MTSIIKDSIDAVLQNQQYNHFKVATTSRHALFCQFQVVRMLKS